MEIYIIIPDGENFSTELCIGKSDRQSNMTAAREARADLRCPNAPILVVIERPILKHGDGYVHGVIVEEHIATAAEVAPWFKE